MTDCCTTTNHATIARRHICPVNGHEYARVSTITIKHQIRQPWLWNQTTDNYYFCTDPQCQVVYFGDDNSVLNRDDLRDSVGIKTQSDDAIVCYCFGVTRQQARTSPEIRNFIAKQTHEQACACQERNPSGKCCLKDFPA